MSPYIIDELTIINLVKRIEDNRTIPDDPALVIFVAEAHRRVRLKKLIDKQCLTLHPDTVVSV